MAYCTLCVCGFIMVVLISAARELLRAELLKLCPHHKQVLEKSYKVELLKTQFFAISVARKWIQNGG